MQHPCAQDTDDISHCGMVGASNLKVKPRDNSEKLFCVAKLEEFFMKTLYETLSTVESFRRENICVNHTA